MLLTEKINIFTYQFLMIKRILATVVPLNLLQISKF